MAAFFRITVIFSLLQICSTDVNAQAATVGERNLQQAAQCLRAIPGLIEGTPEDVARHDAHFAVYKAEVGRLGVPKTFIRIHRGIRKGLFDNIDESRVRACMEGLRRRPKFQ
jgi:hypothetical protein